MIASQCIPTLEFLICLSAPYFSSGLSPNASARKNISKYYSSITPTLMLPKKHTFQKRTIINKDRKKKTMFMNIYVEFINKFETTIDTIYLKIKKRENHPRISFT